MTINTGYLGEQLVSKWLQSKSYRILHHNWHCRWGEIDVIAEDKTASTLVFLEVKTRNKNNWDHDGLAAISWAKQQKISRSAALFLAKNPHYDDFYIRFDVALVRYQKTSSKPKKEQEVQDLLSSSPSLAINNHNQNIDLKLIKYLENAFEAAI